ncbi:type I polyketide synthase domain protein, partial [Mycobacterium ulcerans str. Harvey]
FQHQRYWLLPTAGDFSGANTHAMHPLLDTATELAENADGCSPAGSAHAPNHG